MPPKRRRSTNLDDSETESLYPDVSVQEDERTAPKKRGRKSIIDAILQEEGTVASFRELPSDILLSCSHSSQGNAHTCPTAEPMDRHHRSSTGLNRYCQTKEGSIHRPIFSYTEASLTGYAIHMGSRKLFADNHPLFHLMGKLERG